MSYSKEHVTYTLVCVLANCEIFEFDHQETSWNKLVWNWNFVEKLRRIHFARIVKVNSAKLLIHLRLFG